MEVPNNKNAVESNRQAWNDSARHHQDSPDWQALLTEVTQADFSCLDDTPVSYTHLTLPTIYSV